METSSAVIQLVTTSRGIVVDVQTTNFDTDGRPSLCHSVTKLTIDEAMRVEAALRDAIDSSMGITPHTDARQTALWSNVTFSEPVRRVGA
jgi:hypothetical protein